MARRKEYWKDFELRLLVLLFLFGGPFQIFLPLWQSGQPNKLGLTGNNLLTQEALGASWAYAWTNTMNPDVRDGVPMLWGRFDIHNMPVITGTSLWLMGANEPDRADQANINPWEYVALWHAIEDKYLDRKYLVSPATSHPHPEWLVDFYNAYQQTYGRPPHFDALAVHCYERATWCIDYTKLMIERAKAWRVKEVWVTEFGYYKTWSEWQGDSYSGAKQFVAWLEAEPLVTRYAPFVGSNGDPSRRFSDPQWFPNIYDDASLFVWNEPETLTEYGTWYAKR